MARKRLQKTRIVPLYAKTATDELSETWHHLDQARKRMDNATAAIGRESQWAGYIIRVYQAIHQSKLNLEDIIDQIKEQERAKRKTQGG
jgi:hypothetical protein